MNQPIIVNLAQQIKISHTEKPVVYERVPDDDEGIPRLRRCSSCKDPGDHISPTIIV
jgi:hypothetical protein